MLLYAGNRTNPLQSPQSWKHTPKVLSLKSKERQLGTPKKSSRSQPECQNFAFLERKTCTFGNNRVAQEPNRNRKPELSEPFFPKPKAVPEPPEPFSRNRNRNRNRPFLLNCTEKQKNPFCKGTAGTENRNRLNRSISKP